MLLLKPMRCLLFTVLISVSSGWHSRGGIVGRGVLIDYVAYAARHGISYSATENHRIEYRELEEAAKDQGLVFQRGDILIIRSGLLKWYNECEDSELRDHFFAEPLKQSVGVRAGADTASWIWDHHFSAVAGDALAWESVPYPADTPCKSKRFRRCNRLTK